MRIEKTVSLNVKKREPLFTFSGDWGWIKFYKALLHAAETEWAEPEVLELEGESNINREWFVEHGYISSGYHWMDIMWAIPIGNCGHWMGPLTITYTTGNIPLSGTWSKSFTFSGGGAPSGCMRMGRVHFGVLDGYGTRVSGMPYVIGTITRDMCHTERIPEFYIVFALIPSEVEVGGTFTVSIISLKGRDGEEYYVHGAGTIYLDGQILKKDCDIGAGVEYQFKAPSVRGRYKVRVQVFSDYSEAVLEVV